MTLEPPVAVPWTSILLGGRGVAGGVDGRGEPGSTWREAMMTGRVRPSGSGAGYRRDTAPILEAVLGFGTDEVLVRMEWARLCPAEGVLDEQEVAWVASQLMVLRAAGRRTGIVLTDGAVPAWMGTEAWLMPATPERLTRLAVELVLALDGLLDVVIPVEEPGAWCLAGWVAGSAPPLRIGALRDAMAALDAMLAGQVMVERALSDVAPAVEVAWLMSTGMGQEAERSLLGLPGVGSRIEGAMRSMARRSPGRAAALLESGAGAPQGVIVPFGTEAPSPITPASSLVWTATTSVAATRVTVHDALDGAPTGPMGLRMVHTAARVDERGRISRIRGHHRSALLADALSAADAHGGVRRFVMGEATDRWRWGSFRAREGFISVDRTRGVNGYELVGVDAAGIDAAGGLAELLAGRSR